jgi:hypothetical protein
MWHVLEHLYAPAAAIVRVKDLLKADGLALIATPNISGVDAGVYQTDWIALDAPRHVSLFSPETLTRLLVDHGFVPLARRQLPFDAFFNTMMSERLGAERARSSVLSWLFRLPRAAFVSLFSLVGGSRPLAARFGATLVYLFSKPK